MTSWVVADSGIYLAVAERLNAAFWTTDERFYNTVRTELGWVR